MIDRVPEELWTEIRDIVQEAGMKTICKKKKCKKAKWLSEEALQTAINRKEAKDKGEKERYTHLNAEFQRITRREKKDFISDQCRQVGINRMKFLLCWRPTLTDTFSSVQFSRSVVSDSLRPHESQHARAPCPSPSPRVHSNSRPSSW